MWDKTKGEATVKNSDKAIKASTTSKWISWGPTSFNHYPTPSVKIYHCNLQVCVAKATHLLWQNNGRKTLTQVDMRIWTCADSLGEEVNNWVDFKAQAQSNI